MQNLTHFVLSRPGDSLKRDAVPSSGWGCMLLQPPYFVLADEGLTLLYERFFLFILLSEFKDELGRCLCAAQEPLKGSLWTSQQRPFVLPAGSVSLHVTTERG